MANAKNVRAGRAYVELGIDDKIAAGLNKIAGKFKSWGASIALTGAKLIGLGTAITAPLLLAAKTFGTMGSEILNMSKRTGIAVEALQGFVFAAEQSGSSAEAFETAIKRMQKSIAGVKDDIEGTTGKLDFLGISMEEIRGLSPDKQFELIGSRIAAIEDPTERAAAAMKVFGKSGTGVIPLIEEMAVNLERFKALGVVFTTDDALAAQAFSRSLTDISTQFKAITFFAGEAIAKGLQPYMGIITGVLKETIAWVKANPKLVVGIALVGVAVAALGVTLVAMGITLTAIGTVLATVATIITTVITPVGLITIGLVGLVAVLIKLTGIGTVAVAALREIGVVASEVFGGIADALAGGNIELASKIMFAGLKVIWIEGLAGLKTLWIQFLTDISQLDPFGVLNFDTKSAIGDIAKQVADAQKELQALRDEAAKGKPGPLGSNNRPSAAGIDAALGSTSKVEAVGIFNGAALQSLQSRPLFDRIAKAAEETARNTRNLRNGVGLQ